MKYFAGLVLILSLSLTPALAQSEPIVVGSKEFTENVVLGQLIILALEDAGYAVEDRTALGGTVDNRLALESGDIDVYPEYTATGITNHLQSLDWATVPPGIAQEAYPAYAVVHSLDAAANDLIWLRPAPANNTYALAVSRTFADETGVNTMVEFADYVNDDNLVMLATNDEFAQRPDGLATFQNTYDFTLANNQMIILPTSSTTETSEALYRGINEVNVALVYGTDGLLSAYDFVVLRDDLGAQPIYQPAPVFRGEVLRANPDIATILNPIFASLDNETLQTLNARVLVDERSPSEVARAYLQDNGFINP